MAGRKAYPYVVMNATNDKNRLTKDEIERRKENEPRIKSNALRCPSHLSDGAKKEWRRIVKLYNEFEKPLLSDLDVNCIGDIL